MSPAVGRVMVPIACAIIFQAPGNNDVYYFQLKPYAVFFLKNLLLPEFRSNTCNRIPPPQQLKKESQKSCPTNHKPRNRGLNLSSAFRGGGGGCGKIPLRGGQSFPQARRNPNIFATNANHVYSHFSLQRKERKARANKNKNLRKQNQETPCRNRKTPAFGNNEPEQKLSARRNDQSSRYLYLPQIALSVSVSVSLSLRVSLSLSLRFSSISLLCRQRQKQLKFESYFVC